MPAEPRESGALRVALVGIGSAATRAHLPALRDVEATGAVRVVGVCDPDPARCEAVLGAHPDAAGFSENDEMLDATSPDLLVIATPPSAHLGEMAAAAGRDVHVLCEKPLGLSDHDVSTLRGLASAHSHLALATVHQYRFAAPWRWIARAVAGAVEADEPFRLDVEVERPGTDPLSAGGWRADPEHEGGILGDHAVHYLALFELLDAACEVVACHREGPGGREVASLEVRIGAAGVARVDVSYAGARRANVMRLKRQAQCLGVEWRGGTLTVIHDSRPSEPRSVVSLSDRAVVNSLYSPMYEELISGLHSPSWRAQATAHTMGAAGLLATAIRLAR
ncbi:MAG TPA: Gfo/Idh/MocA family oxidoreductase [Candidatus Deferrimicrobium sp.]|nr:Gfo/Idh/MocA family oxidoreductase [Candidatus Deferrimicrobium sp.]